MAQDLPGDVRGDELELLVRGRAYTGWESMTLSRQLDAVAAQFQVSVADRHPFPIRPEDECTVKVAGTTVLTGFVDRIQSAGTSERREFTVAGRDRTAELVDCSAGVKPDTEGEVTEYVGATLLELARELAMPLGVEVRALFTDEVAAFDLFRLQPGESCWSAIERACRRRGVLAFSSGTGELLLDRPASAQAAGRIVEGENVLEWTTEIDHASRFSVYVTRAQIPGSDEFSGIPALEVQGQATDRGVRRFRPLLVLGEGAMSFDDAEDRAAWEASVRAARSGRLEVLVPGWRQLTSSARVWTVNETVAVRIPTDGIRTQLLVDSVTFQRSAEKTTTRLGLTRPDAYLPQPEVEDFEGFTGLEELGDE